MANLLIADRIKTSLSESALKHVLTIESASNDDWLHPDVLCNVLDVYYANYDLDDRPRASAIGVTNNRYGQNDRRAFSKGNGKGNAPPTEQNPIMASSQVTRVTPQSKSVVLPFNQSTGRRCFSCHLT